MAGNTPPPHPDAMPPLPSPAYGGDDDSVSSSSTDSSDDDFLTSGEGVDRDQLVRKKLLESFYGAAVSAVAPPPGGGAAAGATAAGGHSRAPSGGEASFSAASAGSGSGSGPGPGGRRQQQQAPPPANDHDLDSPSFSAPHHTLRHIRSSSVRALLEADESLALDIRSLDSTMQTLVYENYSKFIDATDAVRNIGKSVDASEAGLARLADGMARIEEVSEAVDADLREARAEVAEKLRLRRLLARLDALLRLPTTLRTSIEAGHTRLAARSHLNATAILGRHSAGFESLKSIEVECDAVLAKMIRDLGRKLAHWSGAARMGGALYDRRHLFEKEGDGDGGGVPSDGDGAGDDDFRLSSGPELPSNVAEIFECAGTLVIFSPTFSDEDGGGAASATDAGALARKKGFDSGLTVAECRTLALDACRRHLERALDSHQMELSERAVEAEFGGGMVGGITDAASTDLLGGDESAPDGKYLIPGGFLDGMLEAATLFGVTFGAGSGGASLAEFVSDLFFSFLGHVRASLMARISEAERERRAAVLEALADTPEGVAGYDEYEDEDDGEVYAEITDALAYLIATVREAASGLALPEVGLDVEAASGLVERAVEMTESMVRRRVARRFLGLRVRVMKKCIVPFAQDAIAEQDEGLVEVRPEIAMAEADESDGDGVEERKDDEGETDTSGVTAARVAQIIQQASVALSDGMQLFDDTVRAILTRGSSAGASDPVDTGMVKAVVEKNAGNFAFWLASVLEVVAGCEDSDPKRLLDLRPPKKMKADDEAPVLTPVTILPDTVRLELETLGFGDEVEEGKAIVLLYDIIAKLDDDISQSSARFDLTLAIAEMCRLAERSVGENMNQSIAFAVADDNKAVIKTNSFFGEGPAPSSRTNSKTDVDADRLISKRFMAAASRILQLYAMQRGAQAADEACLDFLENACIESDAIPSAPTPSVLRVLETAKLASIECANIFGGERMANPVPAFVEDVEFGQNHMIGRSGILPMKGLQLDVERMFTEAVQVFPHSMHMMEFSRNAVVAIVLKVAFKAMIEHSRFATFTSFGYRQLQIDCAFLRQMALHYVKDETMADGTNGCTNLYNLLNDVMLNVGERCSSKEIVGVEEFYDDQRGGVSTPISIGKLFMDSCSDESKRAFVISA